MGVGVGWWMNEWWDQLDVFWLLGSRGFGVPLLSHVEWLWHRLCFAGMSGHYVCG